MFRILPREEKFFDLFEQQAAHIVAAARVLEELTLDYRSAKAKAQQIKELEHAGDIVTHEIVRRLNTTFVTPFDREDIYALASRLDDVLDLIDAAADRLLVYRIDEPTAELPRDGGGDREGSGGSHGPRRALPAHAWTRAPRALRRGEPAGERGRPPPARQPRRALRGATAIAIEVIKWKEIYETMESVTDRCEDVANVIEGIVLKMA